MSGRAGNLEVATCVELGVANVLHLVGAGHKVPCEDALAKEVVRVRVDGGKDHRARRALGLEIVKKLKKQEQVASRLRSDRALRHDRVRIERRREDNDLLLQVVVLPRALVNEPLIILADEPTGNLDLHTGQEIINLLDEMKQKLGITIVTATHDMKMLSKSDIVVELRSGTIERTATPEEMNVTVGTIDGQDVA